MRLSSFALCLPALVWAASATAQESEPDFTLDVGGYGSARFEANDAREVPESFTLRRFVLTTDARWKDRLQIYSEVEYERLSEIEIERGVEATEGGLEFEQEIEGTSGSELALEQAWGQFNITPSIGVRLGAILPPVGRFNLNHDDNVWNFARRPLADRDGGVLPASAAWTEVGLGLVGGTVAGDWSLDWQAYVMNGVELDFAIEEIVHTRDPSRDKLELEAAVSPSQGAFDGSSEADAFAGRLMVSPRLGSEIAVSLYAGDYTPQWLETDASVRTLGLDGRQRIGPVLLEGEVLWTEFGDLDRVIEDFARAALEHATETESDETADLESEIEIELTGVSDTRTGWWLDAGWPLALASGTWGLEEAVLTPVVRYERVAWDANLEELDFAGGAVTEELRADREMDRISIGLAFRPVPQAVFHLAYERSRAIEGSLISPAVEEDEANALLFGMAFGF
jgi:hypothetical protein